MIDGVGTTPFLNYVRVLKFGRVRSDRSDFGPSETYHKLDEWIFHAHCVTVYFHAYFQNDDDKSSYRQLLQ